MRQDRLSLVKKNELIINSFKNRDSFNVSDVQEILGEKRSTVYWTLSNLVHKGYIFSIGKGIYSLQRKEKELKPALSSLAAAAIKILKNSGIEFFISGLDILSVFMEHLPETYPTILFAYKYSVNEVSEILAKGGIDAVIDKNFKNYSAIKQISSIREIILIKETKEFTYSKNNLAVFEKAFVDLYYEITRKNYPLSLQELARIYLNMKRRIAIDTARLKKIASRRNILEDIRYISDYKRINSKTYEFVEFLKKQETK